MEREEAELEAFAGYLPEEASREEITEAAQATIEETGASGPRDIGKVMPVLVKRFQGRADGRVSQRDRAGTAGLANLFIGESELAAHQCADDLGRTRAGFAACHQRALGEGEGELVLGVGEADGATAPGVAEGGGAGAPWM